MKKLLFLSIVVLGLGFFLFYNRGYLSSGMTKYSSEIARIGIGIEFRSGDDDYYYRGTNQIIWVGPGWYYGVWFDNPYEYNYWYRRHYYGGRYHHGRWGDGRHGGHIHGRRAHRHHHR